MPMTVRQFLETIILLYEGNSDKEKFYEEAFKFVAQVFEPPIIHTIIEPVDQASGSIIDPTLTNGGLW